MRYFTYPWKEGELENLVNQIYTQPINREERFIGPLLPFLGGVLIGGLFLPRPTPVSPYGPKYTTPVVPYVQPLPYVNEIPSYSVPVTNSTIK